MPSKVNKKTASNTTTPSAAPPATSPPAPNWPPLQPRLPASHQALSSLLPAQILTTPLLPSSLCSTYRSFLGALPLTTTPASKRRDHAARVNDRFAVESPSFARSLWEETGLAGLVAGAEVDGVALDDGQRAALWGGEVLGLNANIRIYRYQPGQFFAQHYDDYNDVDFLERDGEQTRKVRGRTTWTLLVYLSGPATGCEGGETVFYPEHEGKKQKGAPPPEPVVADLSVGLALLHRHGRECLLHEGREVTKGEKWVIRSDLVVRR